ncbi:tail fiber domain-containing protein [Haladaptatus sp. DFWS20]|uniref:tail fiber domain-containing protein n=1 Tax=Haladaptatus sp. DFWS20 TaxID=3403467 RepID=UPI003EC088AC
MVVLSGRYNNAPDSLSVVAGGYGNTASGLSATVGGGGYNEASSSYATVGGGSSNTASGIGATIPGGGDNTASGDYSFATGYNAKTDSESGVVHDGAVVFADATDTEFRSTGSNQFRSQMPMYAPTFNTTSAQAEKQEIMPVDPSTVLDAVTDLQVNTWEFKNTDDGRHMGPMAAEFNAAFDLGSDEETIASVDADGVALAAIQGLAHQLDEKDERTDTLEADKKDLEQDVANLQQENERLREQYTALEERMAALEDQWM